MKQKYKRIKRRGTQRLKKANTYKGNKIINNYNI